MFSRGQKEYGRVACGRVAGRGGNRREGREFTQVGKAGRHKGATSEAASRRSVEGKRCEGRRQNAQIGRCDGQWVERKKRTLEKDKPGMVG